MNRVLDHVSAASIDIEKSKAAFGVLLRDYYSDKNLNVIDAFKYGTVEAESENEVGQDSFFWIAEHKNIMNFIEIAYDYLLKTEAELNKVFIKD